MRMRMRVRRCINSGILTMLFISAAVVGCGTSRPTSFYLLSSLPGKEAPAKATGSKGCLTLGIGPIKLPDYLDRPQIVTQTGANELQVAEFDQWAEPLEKTFSRVLEENLSRLLCLEQIISFPQAGTAEVDYQVSVNVTRFLGMPDGTVALVAQWSVLEGRDGKLLVRKRSSIRRPLQGQGYAALAGAESQALGDLSREIADAITQEAK
jgi:uncharacterized lipoprotein YmbA